MEQNISATGTDNIQKFENLETSKFTNIKNLAVIFGLSISSGLPFLLLLSTLSIWLLESSVSKTQIGLFAWATTPYALKFLIAPILDKFNLPIFSQIFGRRRSWLLFFQIGLIISLLALSSTNPAAELLKTALCALLVGVFSAGQDIIAEAYRIEILDKEHIGIGSTASVIGYRIGMLISGAGALYLASLFSSWNVAYNIMAAFVGLGIVTTLFAKEPERLALSTKVDLICNLNYSKIKKTKLFFDNLLIKPAKDLFKYNNLFLVLAFIVFFKLVDTILNVMTMPFLIEIGFSKIEIANVAKTFGIVAMILGGLFGGLYLKRCNLHKLLLLCVVCQLVASILFVFQAKIGNNLDLLFVTMGVENVTCGMSQVALVAYLSLLCNRRYTASHYAILSSFASLARVQFSSLGGIFADCVSWVTFYIVVAIFCLPIIYILFKFKNNFFALIKAKG